MTPGQTEQSPPSEGTRKQMVNKLRDRAENESGFTLIELLIVIIILGILATIVLFATGTFTSESKNSAQCANAKIANIAEAAYAAQHNGTDAGSNTTLLGAYMQDGWPADNAPTWNGSKWVGTGCP